MTIFNKTHKKIILFAFALIFCLITNILSPKISITSSKTISPYLAKPKLTVKVTRNKSKYIMQLYMKNVANAKYVEARWKPSKKSKYQSQRLKPVNSRAGLSMGKYKTIYIQIRTYNKKGLHSKYSNLVKVKRTDYKKTDKKKPSPTKIPATASPNPSNAPDKNTAAPSPRPDKNEKLSVTASADTNTPFSYQIVKINAFTNIEAASVVVSSKTNNNTYGPFNMTKSGPLIWYFDAEFFESGEHQIIVTAYGASGETCSTSFSLTVRSLLELSDFGSSGNSIRSHAPASFYAALRTGYGVW